MAMIRSGHPLFIFSWKQPCAAQHAFMTCIQFLSVYINKIMITEYVLVFVSIRLLDRSSWASRYFLILYPQIVHNALCGDYRRFHARHQARKKLFAPAAERKRRAAR
jgi:hypothetical protein